MFVYFAFGTNLSFYFKSDVNLKSSTSPHYNFTLRNVRGKDDQGLYFDNGARSIVTSWVIIARRRSSGLNSIFDHIKYYMRQFQRIHLRGSINDQLYNTDTVLKPGFVQLEHSDGANYAIKVGNAETANKE